MEKVMKRMEYARIPAANICRGAENPRVEAAPVQDLVDSIRSYGVLEPIIVRPGGNGDYILIAGSRRLKAVNELIGAGEWPSGTIPAMVGEFDSAESVEVAVVENLVREDLTPLEEATAFKAYLGAHGDEAIAELGERIGVTNQYIHRRVAVLALPDRVLHLWNNKVLGYGHLEQFLRVDPSAIDHYLDRIVQTDKKGMPVGAHTVTQLQMLIDRAMTKLVVAKFDKKAAGCPTCHKNTKVQAGLFGEDFRAEGIYCNDVECFHKWQEAYFSSNWNRTAIAKEHLTNGFVMRNAGDGRYDGVDTAQAIWGNKIPEDCRACSDFVSLIDINGEVFYGRVCRGSRDCFTKNTRKKGIPTSSAEKPKAEVRAIKHGDEFLEAFYLTELPVRVANMGELNLLKLVTAALSNTNNDAASKCALIDDDKEPWNAHQRRFARIMALDNLVDVREVMASIACAVLLEKRAFSLAQRNAVAKKLMDVDVASDWHITEEYLNSKHKSELIEFGMESGIFKDSRAREYASAKSMSFVKSGDFGLLKKGDLIHIFLKLGIPTGGKVPAEILSAARA